MRVPDYYVRLVELPPTVFGATLPNDDGTFSVYINARLGDAARRETLFLKKTRAEESSHGA